jgi:hypothetical protein
MTKPLYANYFEVGHNARELVIDFGQFYAATDHADLHTRIVMAPVYAEALLGVLQKALDAQRGTQETK